MPRLDRLESNPCRDAGRPAKSKARDRVLSNEELRFLWITAHGEGLSWARAQAYDAYRRPPITSIQRQPVRI